MVETDHVTVVARARELQAVDALGVIQEVVKVGARVMAKAAVVVAAQGVKNDIGGYRGNIGRTQEQSTLIVS